MTANEGDGGLGRAQLLELALAWDAIDVAKEHIIKDDLSDLSVRVERTMREHESRVQCSSR